jgi:pyruvate dehydrogenase E2 component (dihydrolipoamide acetyltransferase)
MEAATLVEWLKQPGDRVQRGGPIAVVETQKGAIEVEAFETGTLAKVLVDEGTRVPVGTPLATIETEHGNEAPVMPEATETTPARPSPPTARAPDAVVATPTAAPTAGTERVRASPAARQRAAELGIDLDTLTGSGPDSAIVLADVDAGASVLGQETGRASRGLDMAEMRKAIAAAMARSKREIPHYYLSHQINLARASDFLTQSNADRPPAERLLMAALLMAASARALARHRGFNGSYVDGVFQPSDTVHLGAAVAIRGGGLIAPAIHDAQDKDAKAIMASLRDLVARARGGRLRGSELRDPTVTVSALGERGVDALIGVIHPPQVALIGFGTPRPLPVADGYKVAVRPCVHASLAADHRVTDGHLGARLLADIAELLQIPETL